MKKELATFYVSSTGIIKNNITIIITKVEENKMWIMFGFSFLPCQISANPKRVYSIKESSSNFCLDSNNMVILDRLPSFTMRIENKTQK